MARKVFISFLGTSGYVNCNYYFDGNQDNSVKNVAYIQEAILTHFDKEFKQNAVCLFFLTETARQVNWEDNGLFNRESKKNDLPNKGLRSCLNSLTFLDPYSIKDIPIPDGFTENEIWEIFDVVYRELQPGDKIYLDVTHAFRSLPILANTLLNFAKAMHNIQVEAIFYGAFEKLGRADSVRKMPIEERNAEVLNLVSFSDLQDWSSAVNDFVNYGKSHAISALTRNRTSPVLRSRDERFDTAKDFNAFAKSLEVVTSSLQTNRGTEIVEGKIFNVLTANLNKIEKSNLIKPMKPIFNSIKKKIKVFSTSEEIKNGFSAVKWCIEHDMVQQGTTMLQESLYTYYCMSNNLDFKSEDNRSLISACFWIKNMDFENKTDEWNNLALKDIELTSTICQQISKTVANNYSSLTNGIRNDINHGGFSKNAAPHILKKRLEKTYTDITTELNILKESI